MILNFFFDEEKSMDRRRFIRTLKNKIYKYVTVVSKKIISRKVLKYQTKYSNANHRKTKIKCAELKWKYILIFQLNLTERNPKCKAGDHV